MKKIEQKVIICPGVIKSGTTLFYELLSTSPQINTAANKEVHFFSYGLETNPVRLGKHRKSVTWVRNENTIDSYLAQFSGEGEFLCDVSPSYLGYPGFTQNVAAIVDEPYFIVTVRDRMARAKSAWMHACRVGLEQESFATAVYRDYKTRDPYELPLRKYFQLSDYDGLIEDVKKEFGPERVRRVEIKRDISARQVFAIVQEFLGQDCGFPEELDLDKLRSNPARWVDSGQWFVKWILNRPGMVSFASSILPKSQQIRRVLSTLVYRGDGTSNHPTQRDIDLVKELYDSEFGKI